MQYSDRLKTWHDANAVLYSIIRGEGTFNYPIPQMTGSNLSAHPHPQHAPRGIPTNTGSYTSPYASSSDFQGVVDSYSSTNACPSNQGGTTFRGNPYASPSDSASVDNHANAYSFSRHQGGTMSYDSPYTSPRSTHGMTRGPHIIPTAQGYSNSFGSQHAPLIPANMNSYGMQHGTVLPYVSPYSKGGVFIPASQIPIDPDRETSITPYQNPATTHHAARPDIVNGPNVQEKRKAQPAQETHKKTCLDEKSEISSQASGDGKHKQEFEYAYFRPYNPEASKNKASPRYSFGQGKLAAKSCDRCEKHQKDCVVLHDESKSKSLCLGCSDKTLAPTESLACNTVGDYGEAQNHQNVSVDGPDITSGSHEATNTVDLTKQDESAVEKTGGLKDLHIAKQADVLLVAANGGHLPAQGVRSPWSPGFQSEYDSDATISEPSISGTDNSRDLRYGQTSDGAILSHVNDIVNRIKGFQNPPQGTVHHTARDVFYQSAEGQRLASELQRLVKPALPKVNTLVSSKEITAMLDFYRKLSSRASMRAREKKQKAMYQGKPTRGSQTQHRAHGGMYPLPLPLPFPERGNVMLPPIGRSFSEEKKMEGYGFPGGSVGGRPGGIGGKKEKRKH